MVCVMAHRDVRSVVRANTMITQVKMIRAKISESLGVLFFMSQWRKSVEKYGAEPNLAYKVRKARRMCSEIHCTRDLVL